MRQRSVSINDLLISQPDTGEQALEISRDTVRSNAMDVIVIDSVAALCRGGNRRRDGRLTRVCRRGSCRRRCASSPRLSKSKTVVIFINQIRMKIGVMFGNPGNDLGRPGAEILFVGPHGYPAHPRRSRKGTMSSATGSRSRSSRTRSPRRSNLPSSISCTMRVSRPPETCLIRVSYAKS
jgi:hypothetical protein